MNDVALADATLSSQNIYHRMLIDRWAADDDRKANAGLAQPMPSAFVSKYAVKNISGSLVIPPAAENNDFTLPIEPLLDASRGVAVVEFRSDSD